jgi:hypothetical protein
MTKEEELEHDLLLEEVQRGILEQWKENEFKENNSEDDQKERQRLPGKNRIYDNRFEMIPFRPKGAPQANRGDPNSSLSVGPSGVAIVVDRKFVELEEQYSKWKEAKNVETSAKTVDTEAIRTSSALSEMAK